MDLTNSIIADLHIHSRFSRACSKNITIPELVKWARVKGLNLLGTSDFSHPIWFEEIKKYLKLEENGFYYYEDEKGKFPFIISGEISLIYTQERGRRIHLVLLIPSIEVAEEINSYFDTKGRRDYDGRPIFKIPGDEFVKDMMNISKAIEIIPAHIWTPWFGLFGSKSGFDSLKECFKDEIENIHAIETGMSCYDKETEVLTMEGWKSFDKLNANDKVCSLNAKTNEIKFQKPTKFHKYFYKGKMYKLKTKRVNLLVTPNHNLFVSHCDFRKPTNFSLKNAEQIFNKSKRLKKNGVWKGLDKKYFVLPKIELKHGSRHYKGFRIKREKEFLMKDWLKFFGFWIAEGWTSFGKNGDYGVYVCEKKLKNVVEIKKILEGFGYKPLLQKNREINVLRIRDYQLFSHLRQFGKSRDKFVPLDIKSLSKELLNIFFEYYLKGDGHIYGRNNKGLSATTTSIRLRDDLQEIALKLGISAYYKLHNKKGTPILSLSKAKLKGYKQSTDSWVIYFIRQNIHTILPSTIKNNKDYVESWINFKGNVYCVSVPNNVLYVRRKGIPIWCGNSDPPMNWRIKELENISIVSFSDSHSFWPWRLGREATIFSKTDSYFEIIEQIRKNNFLATIETDPGYGIYHYDGHRDCGFSCSPEETKKLRGVCPKCSKPLTIGVDNRVEELASEEIGIKNKNSKPFFKLLPLHEVISLCFGGGIDTKKTWDVYKNLISKFKTEFNILLEVSEKELLENSIDKKLVELILRNRDGKIRVDPGFDGKYGVPRLDKVDNKTQQNLSKFL